MKSFYNHDVPKQSFTDLAQQADRSIHEVSCEFGHGCLGLHGFIKSFTDGL